MGTLFSICKRRPNPLDTNGKVINLPDDFEELSETEIMLACPHETTPCKKNKETVYKTNQKYNKRDI
ncbi:orf 38 [Ateline gammaherpesvirus 3]|uniref:Cytoplasmic envelopment protein 3 n=1 Tax=Ateline herpesvirus 3 TaxID=85618 RepID=Q9YTM7_ATHV3|nr:orf 38 [Ateline gammaherpesvirus 3]AAC95564.1 orf 38 [Ateline gammaherpesvirus 3]